MEKNMCQAASSLGCAPKTWSLVLLLCWLLSEAESIGNRGARQQVPPMMFPRQHHAVAEAKIAYIYMAWLNHSSESQPREVGALVLLALSTAGYLLKAGFQPSQKATCKRMTQV
jgi:hypothetical protein